MRWTDVTTIYKGVKQISPEQSDKSTEVDDPVFYPLLKQTTDLQRDIPGRYTEPVSYTVFEAFHPKPWPVFTTYMYLY